MKVLLYPKHFLSKKKKKIINKFEHIFYLNLKMEEVGDSYEEFFDGGGGRGRPAKMVSTEVYMYI